MAKVVIAFDADASRIGKTEDVADEQAQVMVNEGRARFASTKSKTSNNNKSKDKTASAEE